MNFPAPAAEGINSDFDGAVEFVDTTVHDESFSYLETASSCYLSSGSLISDGDDSSKPHVFCKSCSSSHFRSSWNNTSCKEIKIKLVDGELSPEEVRWFHKRDTDKRWIEFSGYDSIRIEQTYRKILRRISPKTSEEKDKLSESGGNTSNVCDDFCKSNYHFDDSLRKSSVSSTPLTDQPFLESETKRRKRCIGVRGGMYEVDLESWKCASIYWPGEECAIMRGTWFYDGSWQPLESPYCDTLESEHINLFYGDKLEDSARDDPAKVAKSALHKKSFPDFHVEWHTSREVYLYSEAASSKLVRSVTQKLGFQKTTGYRLYRGYKVPATLSDRPVDVTHLVFVIHGIGQKMDTGNIIRNSTAFRDCVLWLKQKYFPSSSNLRIEFFPVEWRSSLKLDGDIVEAITPHKVLGLRQILNESAMDVMYYTSPLYGAEVRQGLCTELNRLYSMFVHHNKHFERNKGKVSVLAHSLGCVILYDIVTGWPLPNAGLQSPQSSDPRPSPSTSEEEKNQHKEDVVTNDKPFQPSGKSNLLFEIDNFFCLGSPLSVFLALRWKDPRDVNCHTEIIPPTLCRRLFNIYHPSDPVAYRMEPLLIRGYERIAPLQIQPYNSSLKVPYTKMPMEPLIVMETRKKEVDSECSSNEGTAPNTPIRDRGRGIWNLVKGGLRGESESSSTRSPSSPPTPGLEYRIDYILREGNLGATYISALTSHTAYWTNYDTAFFILTHLIPELKAENSPQEVETLIDNSS